MKKLTVMAALSAFGAFAQTNAVDFANFAKYAQANAQLIAEPSHKGKTVLMGDSITEGWLPADPGFLAQNNLVDRGISGQTTSQMLLRFRNDVIDLEPKTVVILAGINDIAENTGPIPVSQIFANIQSMADLARAHNIKVVLCTVLPAAKFPWRPNIDPVAAVRELNQRIADYAREAKLPLVDYFTAMATPQRALKPEFAADDVHPNKTGYAAMEATLSKVLHSLK